MRHALALLLTCTAACAGSRPTAHPITDGAGAGTSPGTGASAGTSPGTGTGTPAGPGVLTGSLAETRPGQCGGAAVRPRRPGEPDVVDPTLAMAGATLIFRAGASNSEAVPTAEATTDAQGHFTLQLPAGRYCVVEAAKRTPPPAGGDPYHDAQCLQREWAICDALVDVPADHPLDLVLARTCFGPCFTGPPPP